MPLGTLGREPPPFFRQGPSALSKLVVCSALAIFLMVADARFKVMQPLRVALATALYPLQWLAMRPVVLFEVGGIPQTGDVLTWQGLRLEVVDMDGMRIDKLLVSRPTT